MTEYISCIAQSCSWQNKCTETSFPKFAITEILAHKDVRNSNASFKNKQTNKTRKENISPQAHAEAF